MDDTLSINSNRTLNPWEAKEALTHSSVNEMYDDTIDAGAKEEANFDEIITFNHTYLKFRLFDVLTTKVEEFPFLMNHEFLLAGNHNFDEKSFSSMNNKEILGLVKTRVHTYLNEGDVNFKCLFLDNLPNYAREIGFECTVDLLLPIISKISEEKDSVKIKFLQNLKKFNDYLAENSEEGYRLIRDQMIPILSEIFTEKKNSRVIDLCSEALVELTKHIRNDDRGYHVLTIVIVMAHDDQDEESRVLSAKLFNQLAPIIGRELCELYVVPQIASFADDPHSKVRKAVAGNFLNMCMSVSESSFKSKLLPVYQKLSKDSLWIVRKAAAEILPKITSLCDSVTISTTLLEIFRSFTSDNQRYVRIAAIEVLGQFVCLLKKEDLTDSILDFYLGIVDEYYSNKDYANFEASDIIYHCAYNFPAVLYTFGASYWDRLKRVYFKMVTDKESRVKKSLASSLPEIANIVGKEITESDLLPVLDRLNNSDSDIQTTLLKSLPKFLKNLNESSRRPYLDKLKRFLNPREKWRSRIEFSAIIGEYAGVFDDEITYKQIFPIALNFCFDDVAEVRFAAAKNISKLVWQLLSSDTEYKTKCLNIFEAFAHSINYHYRQLFALMCTELLKRNDSCFNLAINYLNKLAFDRVVNVRVSLAKVISEAYVNKYETVDNETMKKIATRLMKDTNKNVNSNFENCEVKEVDYSDSEIINSNTDFTNNMIIVKEEFGIMRNLPLNAKLKIVNNSSLNSINLNKNSINLVSSNIIDLNDITSTNTSENKNDIPSNDLNDNVELITENKTNEEEGTKPEEQDEPMKVEEVNESKKEDDITKLDNNESDNLDDVQMDA